MEVTATLGTMVGLELLAFALALQFRHYLDGVCYPWPVPLTFFGVGAGVVLTATEVHISGVVTAPEATAAGWGVIGLTAFVAFYYYWNEYPRKQRCREAPA